MQTLNNVLRRCLGGLMAAASSLCVAQEGTAPAGNPDLLAPKAYLRGVEVRLPSEGRLEEVRLVGLESEGNGFRDRTPVLERADRSARPVDREALRSERLAMYETPAADVPTVDAPSGEVAVAGANATPAATAPSVAFRRGLGAATLVCFGLVAAAGLLVTWWRNQRRAAGR